MVIAQIAPAVRVAIAETVGLSPGEVTVGQVVTALRQIGFDYVFGEWQQGFTCTQQAHVCSGSEFLAGGPAVQDAPAASRPGTDHPHCVSLCSCAADTLFGADLTIMEEGTELLHRLKAHLQKVGCFEPRRNSPLLSGYQAGSFAGVCTAQLVS